jgi:HD superfamily phosphohydrolase
METELKVLLENLGDVGCAKHEADIAAELYKAGQTDELIRFLKKCRCSLMDEMHESQRKVDRMDYLIRRAEKNRSNKLKTTGGCINDQKRRA